MKSNDELAMLAQRSVELSDDKLIQVLDLIASIPDQGQAQSIINQVRPRLKKLRPPRKPSLQRLFFNPVEDLFSLHEQPDGTTGRLPRSIIGPCWTLISERGDPKLLPWVNESLRRITSDRRAAFIPVMAPLWNAAADILKSWLNDPASGAGDKGRLRRASAEAKLRGHMAELAGIFSVAQDIENAKLNLPPRPITVLSENDLDMIRAILGRVAKVSPDNMRSFVLVMAARMARPGELMKILGDLELPLKDKELEAVSKGLSEDILAALAADAQALRRLEATAAEPDTTALEAERLMKSLVSLERHAGRWADRAMSDRIRVALKELGHIIAGGVSEKAQTALTEALMAELVLSSDLNEDLDEEQLIERLEATEARALTLQRCARIGGATGFGTETGKQVAAVCLDLQKRSHGAGDQEAQRERLFRAVRLTELVAGPEAAYRLFASMGKDH
jgi:hypothetical protein